MKNKEAIRKKIIHYANLTWGVNNIKNLNSLVHLMIEEVCNELYLLDNKLNDIDSTVLERLVEGLSPSTHNYVRPAHAILQIKPDSPAYYLNKKTEFLLKVVPAELRNKNISAVSFTPVTDLPLLNISITNFFHNRTLWSVDPSGNKSVQGTAVNEASYNTVWIKLEASPEVKYLKNLFFYIDFPHLNDCHEYYDILSTIKWSIGDKALKFKQGLPLADNIIPDRVEKDIMDFYKDHYQTISETLHLSSTPVERLPKELSDILEEDVKTSVTPGYWFRLSLPLYFSRTDIDKMLILVNAFPVLNRKFNESRKEGQNLTNVVSLSSGIGEEFLAMDSVKDSFNNIYSQHGASKKNTGLYTVEPIRKKVIEDPRVLDYLNKLIDVIQDERSAFPEIDSDKIMEVINSISAIQDEDSQRIELNRLNDYAQVGRVTVNFLEGITSLDVSYWTTHVGHVNGLPEMTPLMASKVPDLNKSDAILMTAVAGGSSYYDPESLKAINRYYLTSKDRILTKHNILSFCQMELGKYIREVDVVRKAKISPRLKEGLINVMEIQITPKVEYIDYLNEKGVLKDFRTRLKRRSPSNYNYVFNIIEPTN